VPGSGRRVVCLWFCRFAVRYVRGYLRVTAATKVEILRTLANFELFFFEIGWNSTNAGFSS
jgi:hypothetical protein